MTSVRKPGGRGWGASEALGALVLVARVLRSAPQALRALEASSWAGDVPRRTLRDRRRGRRVQQRPCVISPAVPPCPEFLLCLCAGRPCARGRGTAGERRATTTTTTTSATEGKCMRCEGFKRCSTASVCNQAYCSPELLSPRDASLSREGKRSREDRESTQGWLPLCRVLDHVVLHIVYYSPEQRCLLRQASRGESEGRAESARFHVLRPLALHAHTPALAARESRKRASTDTVDVHLKAGQRGVEPGAISLP